MKRKPLPLVTVGLLAANVLAYAVELAGNGERVCRAYGLVPARFALDALLTSMLLHDPTNYSHIVGNLVFLAVFGAIVEADLGKVRFLALYLAAGVAGGLFHVLVDPTSTSPLVGASGAIFGLLAWGALLRPGLLTFVGLFVGMNIWFALTETGGGTSYGAHIGGFVAGFIVAMISHYRLNQEGTT